MDEDAAARQRREIELQQQIAAREERGELLMERSSRLTAEMIAGLDDLLAAIEADEALDAGRQALLDYALAWTPEGAEAVTVREHLAAAHAALGSIPRGPGPAGDLERQAALLRWLAALLDLDARRLRVREALMRGRPTGGGAP